MSRLIEFRGLATNGEFVYGSLVNNCAGLPNGVGQNTKTWIVTSAFGNGGWFNIRGRQYVRPETVGQFTGRLDCNGVKIFEGDITEDEEHYLSVIYFNSDDAMFCATDVGGIADLCTPFKVIGNIHQNSELLK